jgi:hypothetical protein
MITYRLPYHQEGKEQHGDRIKVEFVARKDADFSAAAKIYTR